MTQRVIPSLLAALLLPAVACAQAKLVVVEGTHLDFGRIYRGEVIERTLTLRNDGTDTLVMGAIGVSCGCTGAMATAEKVPPGGKGAVKITFNSKNFAGPIHKTVTLHSNGDTSGATTVEFTAVVIDEIGLNPQSIILPDAEVGKLSTVTLGVTNNGMTSLSLTGFRTQLKGLVLKLPSGEIPPGGTGEIRVEFTPEAPSPLLTDGVFVTTNNARQPEVYIQVYGGVHRAKTE
ncbi:MAG TPA: DUF1573 domain-containing protein [Bacteroidota bacterium]|nr:DUF1573 domain-containing protein [Bacteroidota bacterium]